MKYGRHTIPRLFATYSMIISALLFALSGAVPAYASDRLAVPGASSQPKIVALQGIPVPPPTKPSEMQPAEPPAETEKTAPGQQEATDAKPADTKQADTKQADTKGVGAGAGEAGTGAGAKKGASIGKITGALVGLLALLALAGGGGGGGGGGTTPSHGSP